MMRNNHHPRRAIAALVALAVPLAAVSVAVGQDLPQPRNHVEDRAGVIQDGVERQLIAILADLERKTGAQIIVLTIDSTGGVPIEDYALSLAERWKLGQKDKENGGLVVVAVKDRTYRFEIGYGLEGTLPDSVCGNIGRMYFQPYFRRGDYSNGVYQGVLALVQRVAGVANVKIAGAVAPTAPQAQPRGRHRSPLAALLGSCGLGPIIVLLIVFSILRSRAGHYRRWGGYGGGGWLTWLLLGSMLGGGGRRHYGGGGGWGGGFGGGGFGGFGGGSFGGGGGGGFGGGGASGSW